MTFKAIEQFILLAVHISLDLNVNIFLIDFCLNIFFAQTKSFVESSIIAPRLLQERCEVSIVIPCASAPYPC